MPAPRYTLIEEENLILDAATQCIHESSLLHFKMNDIAKKAGISMGSVYKHVKSKEDVLAALAIRMKSHYYSVIKEILTLPLSGPERLIASVLIDPTKTHAESFDVHLEMLLGNQAIIGRISPSWLEKITQLDEALDKLFYDNLYNDQTLKIKGARREVVLEELVMGIWSMYSGFVQIAFQRMARNVSPLPFPLSTDHTLIKTISHVINSYPWEKPLTTAGIKRAVSRIEQLDYR